MSEGPLEGEVRAFARRSEQISFVSLRIQTLLLRLIKKKGRRLEGGRALHFFRNFALSTKKVPFWGDPSPFWLRGGGTFLPFFFFLLFFYAYPSSDLFLLSLFKQTTTDHRDRDRDERGGWGNECRRRRRRWWWWW